MSAEQIMQVQQQIAQWVFEFAPPNWGKCCLYIGVSTEFGENSTLRKFVWSFYD